MKKIIIFVSLIFAIFLTAVMVMASVQQTKEELSLMNRRVGLILNGSKNDINWCQSHLEGLSKVAEKNQLDLLVREKVSAADCPSTIEQLVSSGCVMIVANSFEFEAPMFEASKKYPEVYFLQANGVKAGRNYASFFGRMYQMRYLAGIVAAKKSVTGELGFVAAMPNNEITRGINAYTLGAQSVNPNAKVHVIFTGSWNSDKDAEACTKLLLRKHPGIDVITPHTNSQRVLQIAEERKIWTIGYNYDAREYYPNTYLTAPVWNWEVFYSDMYEAVSTKKFVGSHKWYGEDTGILTMVPLASFAAPGTEEAVMNAVHKIEKGTFDVFYGPIYDNKGRLRVEMYENISDDVLLNDFKWYVKGVDINE